MKRSTFSKKHLNNKNIETTWYMLFFYKRTSECSINTFKHTLLKMNTKNVLCSTNPYLVITDFNIRSTRQWRKCYSYKTIRILQCHTGIITRHWYCPSLNHFKIALSWSCIRYLKSASWHHFIWMTIWPHTWTRIIKFNAG